MKNACLRQFYFLLTINVWLNILECFVSYFFKNLVLLVTIASIQYMFDRKVPEQVLLVLLM